MDTKRCPYCAEEILAAAKKCKHCREFLDPQPNVEPPKQEREEPLGENEEPAEEIEEPIEEEETHEENKETTEDSVKASDQSDTHDDSNFNRIMLAIAIFFGCILAIIVYVTLNNPRDASEQYPATTNQEEELVVTPVPGFDSTSEKVSDPGFNKGFDDGYLVGRDDKIRGSERRGLWAKQNGERLSFKGSDYSKGYHHGYNEGFAQN